MGKKCIPGVLCIENMTLFILTILFFMVIYLYYINFGKSSNNSSNSPSNIYIMSPQSTAQSNQPLTMFNLGQSNDILNDAYAPPLKNDGMFFRNDSPDVRAAVPINIQTRGFSASYSQIGILTRTSGGDMILPLMGRRIMNGRSKMQYYTISNTGSLNTKLPVSVNGRSCSGEYGCDEISNNDTVYVEGYNNTFRATEYENGLFSYIPVL